MGQCGGFGAVKFYILALSTRSLDPHGSKKEIIGVFVGVRGRGRAKGENRDQIFIQNKVAS